jgi:phosphatidylserine/phosphatidylglycerophosphate/cardiolipin synthase-like enzyme
MIVVRSVRRSYDLAMFGFDDDEKADAIEVLMRNPDIHVRLTLDGTQAGGVHEKLLLAKEKYSNNAIATGGSEHGRIMHLKLEIIDGVILCTGSTNLSMGAETLQDNELTVRFAPLECIEARIRVDAIHAHMLERAA